MPTVVSASAARAALNNPEGVEVANVEERACPMVESKNVSATASAPVVASAFHPALAPVGALLAVAGYLLGTLAGIACSFLLELVAT